LFCAFSIASGHSALWLGPGAGRPRGGRAARAGGGGGAARPVLRGVGASSGGLAPLAWPPFPPPPFWGVWGGGLGGGGVVGVYGCVWVRVCV